MAREPAPVTCLAAKLATLQPLMSAYRHAKAAEQLARIGKKARRIALEQCNGIERWNASERRMVATLTESDNERHDKAHDKMRSQAAAILSVYGVDPSTVDTNRDPRGRGLAWAFPDRDANGFDSGMWSI